MDVDNLRELIVTRKSSIRKALSLLDETGFGLLLLCGETGEFERTITDGDLRRLLLSGASIEDDLEQLKKISSITISNAVSRRQALDLMNKNLINHLPVIDDSGGVIDVLDRRKIDEQILLSTPHMGDFEKSFVDEAFKTNWIAPLGPNVDAFECELSSLVGSAHAAAVVSGTAAIHLALRLLDVGPGDTVFCSSLTFVGSANPIMYQGASPVFIDSDMVSWNMSVSALESAFKRFDSQGRLPKAVIVVNLYGQSADMDSLLDVCNRYSVPMIEDAAESLGAEYKGRASGTFGRLGIYSFNGNKIITTSGGGMLVSDDKELIDRARFLSTQARDPAPHYEHSEVGYNYRMSNILAGVGRGQLKVLKQRVEARRNIYFMYRDLLSDIEELDWMPEPSWSYSTHWLSVCVLNPEKTTVSPKAVIQALSQELIEARPIWKPMHLQPLFSNSDYFSHSEISVSDYLFDRGLCLPSGSNMTSNQIERVCDVIRTVVRQ